MYEYKVVNTLELDYKLSKKYFKSREKSLNVLGSACLEATENRIIKLKEKGYKIISDLSGGYDTRAVIGCLNKYDREVSYYTNEYVQDETIIAEPLFRSLGSPGTYTKTCFRNEIDVEKISELIFRTEARVNYYTTSVCYNDAKYLKENYTATRTGHFGGLGGEFIRHPGKKWYLSIYKSIENKVFSKLSINEACSMVKMDPNECKNMFRTYFKSYKERKKSDILRHFYFEYYKNHVVEAGEDRERIFHWHLQPMLSKSFLCTIFNKIPMKWINFNYFIDFMSQIDERLLNTPIYKSRIDLKSTKSINRYDKESKKQNGARKFIKRLVKDKLSIMVQIFEKLRGKSEINKNNSDIFQIFDKYYSELNKFKNIFEISSVKRFIDKAGGEHNRLITLAMYLREIEKRYSDKIKQT